MKPHITIYDVAKEADVSLATVSRVINNTATVSENTKNRVEQAIAKLNYKPNAIARNLATSKTTTICVVLDYRTIEYDRRIFSGIMDVAKIYDYNILFKTVSRGISKMEDVLEDILKLQVDGVIVLKEKLSESDLKIFDQYSLPFVITGTKFDEHSYKNIGNVYVDFNRIGYDIGCHYLNKGMDDILLIEDHINTNVTQRVKEGLNKAFKEAGKQLRTPVTYKDKHEGTYRLVEEKLKAEKPAKVVVTIRDSHAISAVNTYSDMGLKACEDFELVNVLDDKYLPMSRPTISSYSVPEYDMGAISCRVLTKMLQDENHKDNNVELSYCLIERETTN